jgi:hypothetical protein
MINHSHDFAGRDIVRGLGQVAVVNQSNFFASGVGHHFRDGETEAGQNHGGFWIGFSLDDRNEVFSFGFHQRGVGDGGGDGIGVWTLVAKNINRHDKPPKKKLKK